MNDPADCITKFEDQFIHCLDLGIRLGDLIPDREIALCHDAIRPGPSSIYLVCGIVLDFHHRCDIAPDIKSTVKITLFI